MIVLSVSDLQLIEEFEGMSEFEIVQIKNDQRVAKYAYQMGLDVDFPFMYVPNKHRNLQGKIITGFRLVGEVRCDSEFRNGPMSTICQRLVMTAYQDVSLMQEVAELSYKVRNFDAHLNDTNSLDYDQDRALFPESQLEPDWETAEQEIENLQNMLDKIRGSAYNSSGSLKSQEEYQVWLGEQKELEGIE